MIDSNTVFEAVRRGYSELEDASAASILETFQNVSEESVLGHINNIKGITFELEVEDALREQGLEASVFDLTNHPATDIGIYENGDILGEIQLKPKLPKNILAI